MGSAADVVLMKFLLRRHNKKTKVASFVRWGDVEAKEVFKR